VRAATRLRSRDGWLAAATLAGFGLVALASRARRRPATPELVSRPSAPLTPSATAHPPARDAVNVRPPPPGHFRLPWSLVELILGATVLLAVIGLLVAFGPRMPALLRSRRRRHRLRRTPGQPAEQAPDDLVRRVSETLRLTMSQVAQGQARNGIILCWHRLEELADEAGFARSPADTSTDLASRLLYGLPLSAEPLNRLAALYREARFSSHPLGTEAIQQARADLAQLRSELAARNSAAVSGPQAHSG
jgi:hypothetical protein